MCEDDRIEECKDCGDEACCCDRICHECNLWRTHCICPPVVAHFCKDCNEVVEVEIEVINRCGDQVVFPICSACGSEKVKPVDEAIDAAEYSKGADR